MATVGSGVVPACDGAPWELTRGRRPTALKLGFQRGFGLWHCSDAGRSFCLASSGGGRRWWLATERRFGQDLNMARATHSASSTTWTAPMGAADLREAPGTVGLARAATPARQWGRAAG
jgi:hypothetical protein